MKDNKGVRFVTTTVIGGLLFLVPVGFLGFVLFKAFGFMLIMMMATGLDQVTAFSAVAATLNNLGPGLGEVAAGFMTVSDTAKWIAVVGMLLGRLEIFTLLVLITPTFWRH